jgi:hypothetical protein
MIFNSNTKQFHANSVSQIMAVASLAQPTAGLHSGCSSSQNALSLSALLLKAHAAYILLVVLILFTSCKAQQQHPTWSTHYLLANTSVSLQPCSAQQLPRAWVASNTQRQGRMQLPGTAELQQIIYNHQHPSDCSNAKFLVYKHPGHLGLGAMVDYLADAMAWALAEARVLLLDYQSPWTR